MDIAFSAAATLKKCKHSILLPPLFCVGEVLAMIYGVMECAVGLVESGLSPLRTVRIFEMQVH